MLEIFPPRVESIDQRFYRNLEQRLKNLDKLELRLKERHFSVYTGGHLVELCRSRTEEFVLGEGDEEAGFRSVRY